MKELIKKLKTILDKNNPKIEVNHILVDSENIVISDGRYLIIIKHDLVIEEDMLLINERAKFQYLNQKYSDIFGCTYITDGFRYPEYKRIIKRDSDFNYSNSSRKDLFGSIYWLQGSNPIAISYGLMQQLKKIDKYTITIDKFIYADSSNPLHFKGTIEDQKSNIKNEIYITFMPTIVN
jgi:hypothetical protein